MEKLRFGPEVALTHLELRALLLEHYPGKRREARRRLELAVRELRDMKMQPALERALALQERLEAGPTTKPAYPDGLSPREVEVLRLTIGGSSNQEVAGALFIPTNTVANHVKNILTKTKTNTANRTEAAAYGVRHGLTAGD